MGVTYSRIDNNSGAIVSGNNSHITLTVEQQRTLKEIGECRKLIKEGDPQAFDKLLTIEKSIYGQDRRRNVLNESDPKIKENMKCVVSLWMKNDVTITGNEAKLSCSLFTEVDSEPLWEKEPFYGENCGAFGTGFYVRIGNADYIITAGHCLFDEGKLIVEDICFIFGWTDGSTTISASQVFKAEKVVTYSRGKNKLDYGIVKLSGKVGQEFTPAKLRTSGKVPDNQNLYIIGSPWGLPLKIADGARIIDNSNDDTFTANLDAFGGNSGSPVFNSDDHTVEGILVRGDIDFEWVPSLNRMRSHVIPKDIPLEKLPGEVCTRITIQPINTIVNL